MTISRRNFIKYSALGSASLVASKTAFAASKAGQSTSANHTLVCVFMRGGADGLNMVVPYRDDDYYRLRPNLSIARPGRPNGVIDLDGSFGLHPAMQALAPLFASSQLAIVHAAGNPQGSHSHFESQDIIEAGVEQASDISTGWISRWANNNSNNPYELISLSKQQAKSLNSDVAALTMNSLSEYAFKTPPAQYAALQYALQSTSTSIGSFAETVSSTFNSIDDITLADPASLPVDNGAAYPQSEFGEHLRQAAQLIKSDVPTKVICIDATGWDTHANQAGRLNKLAEDFAQSIAAFDKDMGTGMANVTLLAMTEFGRRAGENGSAGTDHGHGAAMYVLGGNVNGGQVYTNWPGLSESTLDGPGDLEITTDYRSVFYEIMDYYYGGVSLDQAFPGFSDYQPLGLVG